MDPISPAGPRSVRLTPKGLAARWVPRLALFLAVAIGAPLAVRDISRMESLMREGRTVKATVVGKSASSAKGGTTYFLTYQFAVGTRTERDTDPVNYETFSGKTAGDRMTATYLPANPDLHTLGVVDDYRIACSKRTWLSALILIGGVAGIIALSLESKVREQFRMLADYRAILCAVALEPDPAKNSNYLQTVVRFQTTDGKPGEHRFRIFRREAERYRLHLETAALVNPSTGAFGALPATLEYVQVNPVAESPSETSLRSAAG